jgi:hypothetical protein
MPLPDHETAIVLSGGGARAAYQPGALRAIVRIAGWRGRLLFPSRRSPATARAS